MAQLMPLPLTVSCFSEMQIGFTFLVPAHSGSPGQRVVKQVCVCYIRYLLKREVNVLLPNKAGDLPIHLACQYAQHGHKYGEVSFLKFFI